MRHPVPLLRADEAALKPRRPHADDGRKKPRLHMLDRLATRQTYDRPEVARLLGGHRPTISRWLVL